MSMRVTILASPGARWRKADRLTGTGKDIARCETTFRRSPAILSARGGVHALQSQTLLCSRPAEVREALDALAQPLTPSDHLVVIVTGHGLVRDGKLYLELAESVRDHLETYLDIATDIIGHALFETRPRRVMLILDCCAAADSIPGLLGQLLAHYVPKQQRRRRPGTAIPVGGRAVSSDHIAVKQWVVLYATSPTKAAYEDEEGSVFLRLLCDEFQMAFESTASGKETSMEEAIDHVQQRLQRWAHQVNAHGEQTLAPACDGEWRRDLEPYVASPLELGRSWVLLPLQEEVRTTVPIEHVWNAAVATPGFARLTGGDLATDDIETGAWSPAVGTPARTVIALGFAPQGLVIVNLNEQGAPERIAGAASMRVLTRGLRMSSDGRYLAARTDVQGALTLSVYDLQREAQALDAPMSTLQFDSAHFVIFRGRDGGREDRTYLATVGPNRHTLRLYSVTGVLLWDEQDQDQVSQSERRGEIRHLRVSDGPEPTIAAVDDNGVLRIYTVREPTGKRGSEPTIRVDVGRMNAPAGGVGQARRLAIRSDAAYVAVAYGARHDVCLWRRSSASPTDYTLCPERVQHTEPVVACEFSRDLRWLVSIDKDGKMWALEMSEQGVRTVRGPLTPPPPTSRSGVTGCTATTLAVLATGATPEVVVGMADGCVLRCGVLDNMWQHVDLTAPVSGDAVFRVFTGTGPDGAENVLILARKTVEVLRLV